MAEPIIPPPKRPRGTNPAHSPTPETDPSGNTPTSPIAKTPRDERDHEPQRPARERRQPGAIEGPIIASPPVASRTTDVPVDVSILEGSMDASDRARLETLISTALSSPPSGAREDPREDLDVRPDLTADAALFDPPITGDDPTPEQVRVPADPAATQTPRPSAEREPDRSPERGGGLGLLERLRGQRPRTDASTRREWPWTVAARVQRALRRARLRQPIHPIALDIEDESVVARGVLPDLASKKLATRAIESVVGAEHLDNRLRVARPFPMPDTELCARVARALASEAIFRDTRVVSHLPDGRVLLADSVPARGEIVVSTSGGVVELAGHLPSHAHARFAVVVAWWSGGAIDVIERIQVKWPEVDRDGELVDTIRMVLGRDPLLDASQFRVDVRSRRATLHGTAQTENERSLVERDTWYVPGVQSVDNRIEVASAAT